MLMRIQQVAWPAWVWVCVTISMVLGATMVGVAIGLPWLPSYERLAWLAAMGGSAPSMGPTEVLVLLAGLVVAAVAIAIVVVVAWLLLRLARHLASR